MKSKIEWTEKTWNPVTGCTKHSAGCVNCYAEVMAHRLKAMGIKKYKNAFSLTLHEECLDEPLHWRGSHTVFVCSMSDLFHENVPFEFIDKVMETIKKTKNNRYQLLTKRAERMAEYFSTHSIPKNVWLGVTVEDENAKYRIDYLRNLKATIKFLSCEPLLSDLGIVDLKNIDWVIVGGESGVKARPMKEKWVLSIKEQADNENIAFFFKQWGTWGCDGIRRSKKRNGKLLLGKVFHVSPVFSLSSQIIFTQKSSSIKILGFRNIYDSLSLVFEIQTEKKGVVFMCVKHGCIDDEKIIVLLDVKRFNEELLYKGFFEDEYPLNNPKYQTDTIKPKIEQCINGFSQGLVNPVPISEVSYFDKIEFMNGRTRFSWLVAVGAQTIPVQCDKDSVEGLFDLYGDRNFAPYSLRWYWNTYQKKENI